jgi:hypothetical protein
MFRQAYASSSKLVKPSQFVRFKSTAKLVDERNAALVQHLQAGMLYMPFTKRNHSIIAQSTMLWNVKMTRTLREFTSRLLCGLCR